MLAAKELKSLPAVYDISNEEYHSGEGISRSGLTEYKRSPLHFHHKYVLGNRDRKAVEIITLRDPLEFGNAVHTYILEPQKFNEEYFVIEKIARNTIKGKNLYKEKLEEAQGRTLINSEAFETIEKMSESLHAHPDAKVLLQDIQVEKSIYWNDPDTNLLCKARPDIWHANYIADLKTATDGSPEFFSKEIFSKGYHLQAAMIHLGLKELNIDMTNFVYLVVEKQAPFATAVYTLDKEDLAIGIEEVKRLLTNVSENFKTNKWPAYQTACVSMPAFAKREELL
jgi:exodeoxyribonuclease VIII